MVGVREAVRRLRTVVGECLAAPMWSLGDDDLAACLDEVHAAEQALAAVKLHLVRQADVRDLAAVQHAPSCAMWLRHRLRISIQAAKRLVELAREVDRRPALEAALGAGVLNTEQAQVIATTVKDLPAEVGVEAIGEAEGMLIGFAGEFEPLGLRKLGSRILAHVAPEVAEKAEAQALARQEARAHAGRGFTLTHFRDGRVRVSGWLDRETAAVINAALDPLCAPGRLRSPAAGQGHDPARDEPPTSHPSPGRLQSPLTGQGHDPARDEPPTSHPSPDWNEPANGGHGPGRDEPSPVGPAMGWDELANRGPDLRQDELADGDPDPGRGEPANGGYRPGWDGPLADGGDVPGWGDERGADAGVATSGSGPGADERLARDERTPAQRRADALVEVCRLVLAGGQLPDNGGERPQVVVTVPFDVLRQRLGAATLDTGERLSAAQVRRLACDARVIPAVLGGDGQVLDVGSSRRLFTGPLRRALVLRDGGCAFPMCERPARWAEGHHLRHWSDGGPTSLDNGVLLCGAHHRVIHQGDWTVRLGPDRRPEFLPPTYIDPDRKPRRNISHRTCTTGSLAAPIDDASEGSRSPTGQIMSASNECEAVY